MDSDAYAGFLKLLLTPLSRVPSMSADIEAYLRYSNRREPCTDCLSDAEGLRPRAAA